MLDTKIFEPDPVVFLFGAVVALDADPVVARWGQFAGFCGLEFGFIFGAILGVPGIGGYDEAQSNALGGHGLFARDDVEIAVDQLFDFFEDGSTRSGIGLAANSR